MADDKPDEMDEEIGAKPEASEKVSPDPGTEARGDVSAGFTVELQLKDHRLAAELGHDERVPLPFNALAIDAWQRLRAQGRGANDVTDAVFFSAEQARVELG